MNCLYITLEGDIKTESRTNLKDSLYLKFMSELKANKKLLEVGAEN